jgi:NADPH:quinone reductase-like Zn-dependent oxidoreductase
MKAMVYERYGSPDVLHLEEVETPVPKANEVLVKVHAASINSWDWDLLVGKPAFLRLAKPQHPILGADVAGRVEAVGPEARRLRPGDEVFGDLSGCGWGGFAEYVCAAETALAPKPAGMSFEQAAAVPQAGVLALQGLRHKGEVHERQTVLVNGAGGGVGTFAVQLARSHGAVVTGVDRAEKLELLRSIGAEQVIDYAQEDFTASGRQYDLILDVVAQRSPFDYRRALSAGGRCVLIGGSGAAMLQGVLFGPWMSMTGGRKIELLIHRPNTTDLERICEYIAAGTVAPVVDRRYPLAELAEAFRYFGAGQTKGKIVIIVDPGVET